MSPPDPVPLVEARGIGRRLPDDSGWLFRDLSLAVGPGERVAIAGPTGSGKTLLLRSLALLDPLDAGLVLWRGNAVAAGAVPEFRCRAIYLHQRPALFPGSVDENLRSPYALKAHRGRRFDRDFIVERLRNVGRDEPFLDRLQHELSGGERQIVALLRAIQLEPIVLLLDEPTAALDAETARAVESLVETWQSEAEDERAVVWVSHNTAQVERVARRVLSIRDRQLRGEG